MSKIMEAPASLSGQHCPVCHMTFAEHDAEAVRVMKVVGQNGQKRVEETHTIIHHRCRHGYKASRNSNLFEFHRLF